MEQHPPCGRSESLGHVPIIDVNPRRDADRKRELKREAQARRTAGHVDATEVRYRERSTVGASTVA